MRIDGADHADGAIVRDFAGAERTFRLGVGEWRKIQNRCDCGPPELVHRLGAITAAKATNPQFSALQLAVLGMGGTWRVDDAREVILQGLIGGGLSPTDAGKLVGDYFDRRFPFEHVPLAFEIVCAAAFGPEDDPLGKSRGATEGAASAPPPHGES